MRVFLSPVNSAGNANCSSRKKKVQFATLSAPYQSG